MKSDPQLFFERILNSTARVEGPALETLRRGYGNSITLKEDVRINCYNGECSLHCHSNRTEEYIILGGSVGLYRGNIFEDDLERTIANLEFINLSPGDRVIIDPRTVHTPTNLDERKPYIFLEINSGNYKESDVKRIYDPHGRDPELNQKWQELGYEQWLGRSVKDFVLKVKEQSKK